MRNHKSVFLRLLPAVLLTLSLTACAAAPAAEAQPTPSPVVTQTPVTQAPETTEAPAETEAPATPAPLYDQAAYDAAVNAVLAEYRDLDMEDPSSFDEAAHPELPWYTAIVANTLRNDLYYGFWDFDGNGVPELVIAAGDDQYQIPMGIYAFDGGKMVYLCKEQPLGERAILTYTDGLFFVHASGGAASGAVAVYRIAPDGYGTDLIEIMDYEYQDPNTVIYTPQLGGMTPEEFAAYDTVAGFHEDVEYTLFAARKAESMMGMPNPWQDAASPREAADGAGLESFTPPEYLSCFPAGYEVAYRCMNGLAEAVYDDANHRLVVRKGAGADLDVSGDYNAYPESRDVNWKGLTIHCFGADGQVKLARWSFGGNSYSLTFNADAPGMPGLGESDVTSLVNQIQ